MSRRALVLSGGWEGHQPAVVGNLLAGMLQEADFQVEHSNDLAMLEDADLLASLDLFVPNWTMGQLPPEAQKTLCAAVRDGLGIAGCHGGMGDSFRANTEYQFMVGGQFVAHPGNDGVEYTVRVTDCNHEITVGIEDFTVHSEQYYMHVDPAIHILATTNFPTVEGPHSPNGSVEIPTAWTKLYGNGRVFYCALGHSPDVLRIPEVRRLMIQGFAWAAK